MSQLTAMGSVAFDYIHDRYPLVISFKELFSALSHEGLLPAKNYETQRKQLQRSLKYLLETGCICESESCRGYRLVPEKSRNAPGSTSYSQDQR